MASRPAGLERVGAACLHRWLGGWERQPGVPECLRGEVCHRSGGQVWKVEGPVCQGVPPHPAGLLSLQG